MRMLIPAFRFLVFSNIYVALCAMTFTAKTSLLLYGNNGNIRVNALVFSATLFLYCFHRLYHRSKMLPEERAEERHQWADRNKMAFITITVVAFISSLLLMLYMPLKIWLLLIPVAVLGLGYSLPCIPSAKGWIRLRDISWLKIVWIALAYAWLTTFIPVAYAGHLKDIYSPGVLFVFIRSFIVVFVLVIPFDIRDIQHDSKNGVKSLPVLIGVDKTTSVAYTVLILFALAVIAQLRFFNLSIPLAIALLISAIEIAVVVPIGKTAKRDLFYPLAIETSMILHWLLLYIAVKMV